MNIQRISAFSHAQKGGNPAGVLLLDAALPTEEMARLAKEIGYSETAFAVRQTDETWRVRYFSPETEVPFCGHATIALGYALGQRYGAGVFQLALNEADIRVEASDSEEGLMVTLASPPTHSRIATDAERQDALALFGLTPSDLDERLPAARIHGGADHVMLALKDRATLSAMHYDLAEGREMMRRHGIVTIMLVHCVEPRHFDVRNAFASGGVLEDPATGAAAAAFAGFLRDQNWPHGGAFTVEQGVDMGMPSRLNVSLSNETGAAVNVAGQARMIGADDA